MLRRILIILVMSILALLLARCTRISQTAPHAVPTLPGTAPYIILLSATQSNIATIIPPTPTPGIQLPQTTQVIFTIPNPQPWSGREGDPRPDWLGWGAETFAAAPDGTFWIADSAAAPHRLLHFTAQGELLLQVSMSEHVIYPYHLVAALDSLWVLDISGMQPRVVQLSLEGAFLSQVDIPPEFMTVDGMFASNAAFGLMLGESGELLLYTLNGIYELVDAGGAVVSHPLEALNFYGHAYQPGAFDQAAGHWSIIVDSALLEMPATFSPDQNPFLGFNPDGSFVLSGFEHTNADLWDRQVLYYHPSGELLGMSRQLPQLFFKDYNHHLAFGPDGSVYQLLSHPDHSVQIVRLGFSAQLPPIQETPTIPPTPLATLLPSTSAVTDEEQARNALLAFFASLSSGNYANAAPLFGGEIEEYFRPPEAGETAEAYWGDICRTLWCLPIAEVTSTEQVSADEYLFYVVFAHPEWGRFEIGACCGADPAAYPPIWQFAYPVKKIDGVWMVMRAPLYTP